MRLVRCLAAGFALDLDSTVFCREGATVITPLLAVLAEARLILDDWLRSGNTGAARGVVP